MFDMIMRVPIQGAICVRSFYPCYYAAQAGIYLLPRSLCPLATRERVGERRSERWQKAYRAITYRFLRTLAAD